VFDPSDILTCVYDTVFHRMTGFMFDFIDMSICMLFSNYIYNFITYCFTLFY